MKTLLQISVCVNVGSVGRIAEEIGAKAQACGWQSHIAYARAYYKPSSSKTIKIGSKWSVAWHGAMTRLFDRHGLASRGATKQLIRHIETIKPDIIHLHNLHGYYIHFPLLFDYLAKSGVPVVWTLHDCWAFTGHCAYFSACGCERWRKGCHDCPQKKSYPSSFGCDRSRANYSLKQQCFTKVKNMTLVTPSQWLAGLVKESFLKACAVKVINNGIDTKAFQPTPSGFREQHGWANKKIVLGVAAQWGGTKGLADIIKLSSLLDDSYQVVLVGVTKQIKKRLPANVSGIEKTNSVRELAEIYSAADVFVNPTHQDNYPTTNLEARACGTPVITYDVGGSPESAGPEAVVVNENDVEAIKDAVEEIVRKGKPRATNGAHLSSQHTFQQYIDLYEQLTNCPTQ